MTGAFIAGCAGLSLSDDEWAFFRQAHPLGFILFKRNIDTPDQVKRLVGAFRDCVGGDAALVLVDQEGGRVQRLGPPHWRRYPKAARFGTLFDDDPVGALRLTRLSGRRLARDMAELGINCDCLPVLDVPQPGSHDIIGDRAYHADPRTAVLLAGAHLSGLEAGGVAGVIKHIPGHGRALADSHLELPVVTTPRQELERTDFLPFAAHAGASMAMTAHVIYEAIDAEAPATLSPRVIGEVIRGAIGFDGLLMTDDLSMHALTGPMRERGERALGAGCDVLLHCNGDMAEMTAVAEAAGTLAGKAAGRARRALHRIAEPDDTDLAAMDQAVDSVFALTGEGLEMA